MSFFLLVSGTKIELQLQNGKIVFMNKLFCASLLHCVITYITAVLTPKMVHYLFIVFAVMKDTLQMQVFHIEYTSATFRNCLKYIKA